jgi:hypothetical protein
VYGAKQDIRKITADEMLAVYTVNTVGPLLVVQQLLEAGLIGGLGGKTLVANVTSKVCPDLARHAMHVVQSGDGWRGFSGPNTHLVGYKARLW